MRWMRPRVDVLPSEDACRELYFPVNICPRGSMTGRGSPNGAAVPVHLDGAIHVACATGQELAEPR